MSFVKRSTIMAGLGLTLIGGAMAATSDRHDGTWSIRMITDAGICDRSYDYSIAIEKGSVRYLLAPGDSPTTVSGQIGPMDPSIWISAAASPVSMPMAA
jgi:hypothetical protein